MKLINTLHRIFRDDGLSVYDDSGWNDCIHRKMPFIGAIALGKLPQAMDSLKRYRKDITFTEVDTQNMRFVFFAFNGIMRGVLCSHKEKYLTSDPDILNLSLPQKIFQELKINCDENHPGLYAWVDENAANAVVVVLKHLTFHELGISEGEYDYLFFLNSHKMYKEEFLKLAAKKGDSIPPRANNGTYDHIAEFSRVYYWILKIAADYFCGGTEICFHDAGTNVGQLPLLISSLNGGETLGLKIGNIVASDIGWSGSSQVRQIVEKHPTYRPIQFIKLDIVKQPELIPYADITIAIDVLEHLKSEKICGIALKNLWEKTKKLLVIHVPLEAVPSAEWGHYISFSGEKLRKIAAGFADGHLLSDSYFEDNEDALTDHGYLVVSKN
jgi:hypothetical protein